VSPCKKGGFYSFDIAPLAIFESFFGTANPYSALMDISNSFEAGPVLTTGSWCTRYARAAWPDTPS